MSDIVGLKRKISVAQDLRAVVRTMKAVAASNIGQYERAVGAIADYYRTIELALGASVREDERQSNEAIRSEPQKEPRDTARVGVIVFGSDQGLVGRFNEVLVEFVTGSLAKTEAIPGAPQVWAVGERVRSGLTDAGLTVISTLAVPTSVKAITSLVGQILIESAADRQKGGYSRVFVFHNRPISGALSEPVCQRLLPLDEEWRKGLANVPWPTKTTPEILGSRSAAEVAMVREYLFISLFRACAESLAAENASRLAAMQRADKNIADLLDSLSADYHRERQAGIDEELFDVVSGFEAMVGKQ